MAPFLIQFRMASKIWMYCGLVFEVLLKNQSKKANTSDTLRHCVVWNWNGIQEPNHLINEHFLSFKFCINQLFRSPLYLCWHFCGKFSVDKLFWVLQLDAAQVMLYDCYSIICALMQNTLWVTVVVLSLKLV